MPRRLEVALVGKTELNRLRMQALTDRTLPVVFTAYSAPIFSAAYREGRSSGWDNCGHIHTSESLPALPRESMDDAAAVTVFSPGAEHRIVHIGILPNPNNKGVRGFRLTVGVPMDK